MDPWRKATGEDEVGKGDVRLLYTTDTLYLEIERLPTGKGFEFSVALRGEIALAGVFFQYYEQGLRRQNLGFYASYVGLLRVAETNALSSSDAHAT